MKNLKMKKQVVHCKRSSYDVYIGRPGPFGNPYEIGKDGNRKEVIKKFWHYAIRKILTEKGFDNAIANLKDKVLGCWCAPKPCHGDVLEALSKSACLKCDLRETCEYVFDRGNENTEARKTCLAAKLGWENGDSF